MTVNIYDDINRLDSSFRKTTEFVALEQAVLDMKDDEESLALFKSFRDLQLTLQEKQQNGEEISGEELEHAQKTAQLAQSNAKIESLFTAESNLSGIVEEVNRVLMKPIKSLYETF